MKPPTKTPLARQIGYLALTIVAATLAGGCRSRDKQFETTLKAFNQWAVYSQALAKAYSDVQVTFTTDSNLNAARTTNLRPQSQSRIPDSSLARYGKLVESFQPPDGGDERLTAAMAKHHQAAQEIHERLKQLNALFTVEPRPLDFESKYSASLERIDESVRALNTAGKDVEQYMDEVARDAGEKLSPKPR